MKITKRKWGEHHPPLYFYRDEDSGRLLAQNDRKQVYTDTLFNDIAQDTFERSLRNRLLKTPEKGDKRFYSNEIVKLVEKLCQGADVAEIMKSMERSEKLRPKNEKEIKNLKKQLDGTLSEYGKRYTAPEGAMTLNDALFYLVEGNPLKQAMAKAELGKIREALIKEKENRINRVRYSIKNNKIPLRIQEDGGITPNNDRAAWLLGLMKPADPAKGITDCYPLLGELEEVFDFDKLSKTLHEKISRCQGRPRSIAMAVDEALKQYLRELWEKSPSRQQDLKYYFQAVQEYFKDNFPIRTKRMGARLRQELLKDKTSLSRLLEPKHMANAVRRRLINQSTQMHILYGKLYAYCCGEDGRLLVNSETLQRIQVHEAVKKQAMTAVLWSISRLRYFYQFEDGDILSNKNPIKDFRDKFLRDTNKYTHEDVEACKEKLQDFFPLKELQEKIKEDAKGLQETDNKQADTTDFKAIGHIVRDDRKLCNQLLAECVSCIGELRHHIFHYKNVTLIQALKRIADKVKPEDLSVLRAIYLLDRRNLKKAFAKRISSMNLPLYYREDLLSRIFKKEGTAFFLYSAKIQMTPSFQRVYERGKNLRREFECERMKAEASNGQNGQDGDRLKWFRQLAAGDSADTHFNWAVEAYAESAADVENNVEFDTDVDAQRALRNLLLLIYRHHFLPEVQKDETLVTGKIHKVLERNRQLSEGQGPNQGKAHGYSVIEELYHEGMPLSDLMKQLQRRISETERESRELAQEKTDYAQRFILDIFAEAFNDFLEAHYGEEYLEIMSPRKDAEAAKKWVKESKTVDLKTSIDEKEPEGHLLVLYPVLRLLDERELGELQQQMIRYRTSLASWQGESNFSEEIRIAGQIEELTELVKLTEPEPQFAEEVWGKRAKEAFEDFIEGNMKNYEAFYLQSDNNTPVYRRNMSRLLRSGLMGVYQKVLASHKQALKRDYLLWSEKHWNVKDENGADISSAEQAQCLLQRLHRKYAESPSRFTEEDCKLYEKVLRRLEDYNQAVKNLSFSSLYEICVLNLEILSRWVGFVQDWERDMYFLLLAWVRQGKLDGIKEKDVSGIFYKGSIICKLFNTLEGGNWAAFASIYCPGSKRTKFLKVNNDVHATAPLSHEKCQYEFLVARNMIAHLDLMRKNGWRLEAGKTCSVMEDYINRLRFLLSYDQKRMNAVTKTLQQIFDRHKVKIRFTVEKGGMLKIEDVTADKIVHLKGSRLSGIEIPSHGERFIDTLKALMVYPRG